MSQHDEISALHFAIVNTVSFLNYELDLDRGSAVGKTIDAGLSLRIEETTPWLVAVDVHPLAWSKDSYIRLRFSKLQGVWLPVDGSVFAPHCVNQIFPFKLVRANTNRGLRFAAQKAYKDILTQFQANLPRKKLRKRVS